MSQSSSAPKITAAKAIKGGGAITPAVSLASVIAAPSVSHSCGKPFGKRSVHGVGLLDGGQVATIRDDDKTRAGNSVADFFGKFRRRQLVSVADQNQSRTTNHWKLRPRIRARHQSMLLADKSIRAGVCCHVAHNACECFIFLSGAMQEARDQRLGNIVELTGLRQT